MARNEQSKKWAIVPSTINSPTYNGRHVIDMLYVYYEDFRLSANHLSGIADDLGLSKLLGDLKYNWLDEYQPKEFVYTRCYVTPSRGLPLQGGDSLWLHSHRSFLFEAGEAPSGEDHWVFSVWREAPKFVDLRFGSRIGPFLPPNEEESTKELFDWLSNAEKQLLHLFVP